MPSLADLADEIDKIRLDGVTTGGLTSGACVPEAVAERFLERLALCGFVAVELLKAAEEHQPLSLPREVEPPRPRPL
ncbi:hypothetical protein SGFS_091550 [Streptomyces graminofaciens]|uniref:Uncharacterized protein n=1 Tax=Streptomyces graminofaciens TaxID=68212 RepID=A0ABN5W0H3_9ACTN|nr:hypothetical protein [Streptomyces graminofaciens]BBC37861.1 hypothetical protein SGFS_091550 [Streptomyces graminofaciens]